MFSQTFMRIDTFFFPRSGLTLVPDPRYVQRGAWNRTMAARLVVEGPSTWLAPIIDNDVRSGIFVESEVTLTPEGIAEVALSASAVSLSVDDATRLAIEIAAVMRNVAGVHRVRLLSQGGVLSLAGLTPDGSIPVSLANNYDYAGTGAEENLALVLDGVIASFVGGEPILASGDWGSTQRSIASFAVSRLRNEIAAATPEGLLVGVMGGAPPEILVPGQPMLRPQYDLRGNLWAIASGGSSISVTVISPTERTSVDASALAGMAIHSFQVAPDGRRIAMIRIHDQPGEGARMEVGIALINYDDGTPVAITSWKPIRLTWEGSTIRSIVDLAWMGPSSLLILGGTGTNPPGVYITDIDGLGIDEWGLPQAWDPVEMATHITSRSPQIVVLDRDGTAWFYQDGLRWSRPLTSTVSAVTFPV